MFDDGCIYVVYLAIMIGCKCIHPLYRTALQMLGLYHLWTASRTGLLLQGRRRTDGLLCLSVALSRQGIPVTET